MKIDHKRMLRLKLFILLSIENHLTNIIKVYNFLFPMTNLIFVSILKKKKIILLV